MSEPAKPLPCPQWWPECPWDESVWTNTMEEITPKLVALVPDGDTRTAIAGVLMRHGWRLAEKAILEGMTENRSTDDRLAQAEKALAELRAIAEDLMRKLRPCLDDIDPAFDAFTEWKARNPE